MAETLRVLAQVDLSGTSLTDIYTVPAGLSASVSSVTLCNRGAADITVRLSIAVAGLADTNKQYLRYDYPVPAKGSIDVVIGLTLAATDVIRAKTDTANVSVNVFGVEIG